MISQAQIAEMTKLLNEYAGEVGTVELTGTTFCYLGSELATLRLLKAYRRSTNGNQGYSQNLGTFYFSLLT